jgi:hypothetical protein
VKVNPTPTPAPAKVSATPLKATPTPTPAPTKATPTPTPAPAKATPTPTPAPAKANPTPTPAPAKAATPAKVTPTPKATAKTTQLPLNFATVSHTAPSSTTPIATVSTSADCHSFELPYAGEVHCVKVPLLLQDLKIATLKFVAYRATKLLKNSTDVLELQKKLFVELPADERSEASYFISAKLPKKIPDNGNLQTLMSILRVPSPHDEKWIDFNSIVGFYNWNSVLPETVTKILKGALENPAVLRNFPVLALEV